MPCLYPGEIAMAKFSLFSETMGFAFPKGSPLLHLFQARIGELIEKGFADRVTLKMLKEKQSVQCQESALPDVRGVDFLTIQSGFYLLLCGVIASGLILMSEIIIMKQRNLKM